jgi:hypothetical protein
MLTVSCVSLTMSFMGSVKNAISFFPKNNDCMLKYLKKMTPKNLNIMCKLCV